MAKKSSDLREACVAEAMAIIGEAGVEGLSIREVARRLGVSHQAPYKHFPSSDHLLAEIVRRTYSMFSRHLETRPANSTDEMRDMGVAYYRFAMEHPLHYRLLFGTPLPDPTIHKEMMQEARYAFTVLLDAISKKRGVAVTSSENQLDALFIWSTLHGLSTIVQTAALEQLGLSPQLLEQALPHTLQRIGAAFREAAAPPPPEKTVKTRRARG
jgi:AcrR family transcriptional regulator